MSFSLKLKSVVFLIKLDEKKISSASLQFNNELALFSPETYSRFPANI